MPPSDWSPRAPVRRIPKLAYRNPLPADQTSLSSSCKSSTADTLPSSPDTLDLGHSSSITSVSNSYSTPERQSFEARSFASSSLASDTSSSSKDSKATKKKKTSSVLGFLTLKEPSQSAFEQYAEQQLKNANITGKPGKRSPAGSASSSILSAQKLPANVPKVNSKWDGIPESVKASKDLSSKRRISGLSQSTSARSYAPSASVISLASDTSHAPPNSLASGASSMWDVPYSPNHGANERRDSGPSSIVQGKDYSNLSSPSTNSLPEMTYFFPDDPSPSGTHSASSDVSVIQSPSTIPPPIPWTSDSAPQSITTSTSSSSPDPLTFTVDAEAEALYRRLSSKGFLAGEAQEFNIPHEDDSDSDSPENDTHDFLFEKPHITIKDAPLLASSDSSTSTSTPKPQQQKNFSRPLPKSKPQSPPSTSSYSRPTPPTTTTLPLRNGVSRLPTLYEASIASVETNATITDLPEPTLTTSNTDIDTEPISRAASIDSVTPSEMSASWYRSPRERLGLGSRVRKDDVLPWEEEEEELRQQSSGKRRKNPLSMVFAKAGHS